jgi:hypothetical protein
MFQSSAAKFVNYQSTTSSDDPSVFGFLWSQELKNQCSVPTDYRCEVKKKKTKKINKKSLRVWKRYWDILLSKYQIITPKKRTVMPEDAYNDTVFDFGVEIVKFC